MRIGALALILALELATTSCTSVTPKAVDTWRDELRNESFTAMYPPRAGDGMAAVITFDDSGREIIVLSGAACFPTMKSERYPVAMLSRETKYDASASLAAQVAEVLQGKVNAKGLASAETGSTVALSLDKPYVERYETALLRAAVVALDRQSQCFKSITNPKNLIIYSVVGATGVKYKMEDKGGAALKFSADIMKFGNVSPDLSTKYLGNAELVVSEPMLIGYKAVRADVLPGAFADSIQLVPMTLENIAALRKR